MVKVEIDKSKNLLKITMSSVFSQADSQECYVEVQTCLAELNTGYTILTDMSDIEKFERKTVPNIRRIMDICNQKGVAKIVRIIPDKEKDIGFNILSTFHYSNDVKIITCSTSNEALRHLSS